MEKEIFESIPENFSRKDMKKVADGKVTDTTLDYYLKNWINQELIKKTGYGKYTKLSSEWKESVKYLPNRTEDAKAIRAYIRKLYNSVCSFKFENINILQINEDSVIFQTKLTVSLMDVLLMSETLYGLKDCFTEDCELKPLITGRGEVVYENVKIECKWSQEKLANAKRMLRKR